MYGKYKNKRQNQWTKVWALTGLLSFLVKQTIALQTSWREMNTYDQEISTRSSTKCGPLDQSKNSGSEVQPIPALPLPTPKPG